MFINQFNELTDKIIIADEIECVFCTEEDDEEDGKVDNKKLIY